MNLIFVGCQSRPNAETVAADLNSTNPALAAQAQKVQQLQGQLEQQEAVIEAEKRKLAALKLQLEGAEQNLEGVRRQSQATP
ncbi:hypothetical protein [Hymenobacter sp. YC55]|uniref:hypothetical protein n=1 Tax=Hymenobacter sp. YC55 TaxID=3034019 RepID=UPI0023F96D02|nr:hypothetical protein [Hymenobacter sp. YC55]MDF7813846.1 hypothetical protein [Hymenobacter sp. YC55]